jgi:hypothetical protein
MFLSTILGKRPHTKSQTTIEFNRVVYPCLSSEEMLSSAEHAKLLTRLSELVGLPADYHQTLYLDLIDNFANFVQILPNSNHAQIGSILNHGLQRALYALQVHREKTDDPHNHLMSYTIFSAALLFEIGKVIDDRKISICDKEGKFIADWSPFQGPISDIGHFYKIREVPDMPNQYHLQINPILARQVMPSVGYHWIAEHPKMLHAWLAMLAGKEPTSEGFSHLLEIVKLWLKGGLGDQRFFFPEIDLDNFEPVETSAGERFLAWLKKGLADGSIDTNGKDAMAHMTPEGLFLEAPAIFEKFSSEHEKYKNCTNWAVVVAQFNAIGVTKLSGGDVKYDQYYAENPSAKGVSATGVHARKGVFAAAATATAATNLSERYQGSQAKVAAQAMAMKEGLIISKPEIAFGTSPIPPVSALLKPVSLDPSLPVMQQMQAMRHPLPPLFSEPSTTPLPTMPNQQSQ